MKNAPRFLQQKIATVAIREYAAHSFLYYKKDASIISDGEYDQLCKWLLQNYDAVKPWDISGYLNKSMLKAGSGYDLDVIGQTRDYALFLLGDTPRKKPKIKKEDDTYGLA